MWSSIIAVAGTLLGGIVTGLIQNRHARGARTEAREDQRRGAQLQALTALASAVAAHRRAMWVREDLRLSGAAPEAYEAARAESHATRDAITAPLVSLSVLAPALASPAKEAARASYRLRGAADAEALSDARDASIAASEQLIAAAGAHFA
ncbi:protein kilB [Streptomyces scopuliridis]|uniref:protein kilB n=1 Tax=Streptomyces scopuliridis TaxID=452529 RepID=UPI003422446E